MEPTPCKKRKTTREEDYADDALAQMCCSGYVFYMSDGSRFRRSDVELVTAACPTTAVGKHRSLDARLCDRNKQRRLAAQDDDDDDDDDFSFHMCDGDNAGAADSFRVFIECGGDHAVRTRLSSAQTNVLKEIQSRVDADRADGRRFTCAIIEGPGGCGKTRVIAHVMNHRQMDTLVLYVTKQNKRVQDFIHVDCLSGETDTGVQKPVDMTPMSPHEIEAIVQRKDSVGRFAVTAEKLVYAIAGGRRPSAFDRNATPSSIGIVDYDIFGRQNVGDCEPHPVTGRNVVVLLDEYTMHQSPLIHALAYHVMRTTRSPLVLIMAGDRFQCGPVGWDGAATPADQHHYRFTGDVRRDIVTEMKYTPLELRMEKLQRCDGDAALSDCVRRLRRVCESAAANGDRYKKNLLRLILTRYSVDAGVHLYVQERPRDDGDDECYLSPIRRVVPTETHVLDFGGVDENDDEEYDENCVVELRPCGNNDPPTAPAYDLSPLVNHFVALYTKLAESTFRGRLGPYTDHWMNTVRDSVAAIQDLFPLFVVLSNNSCNVFAETFLLALYTQIRDRLLRAPVPSSSCHRNNTTTTSWHEHLERTLRRNVRRLALDDTDLIRRQTLFVGMVYKMTSTFKTNAAGPCYLCNGETVVLTSIVYDDDDGGGDVSSTSLTRIRAVKLRKLQRDAVIGDVDFTLPTGRNKNRMTGNKQLDIMPFVPYVSENIFQMQGNTMPAQARTFVDLVNAPCKSAYVAVSRFQNSDSIRGIVISE